jgi:hypothetical protein
MVVKKMRYCTCWYRTGAFRPIRSPSEKVGYCMYVAYRDLAYLVGYSELRVLVRIPVGYLQKLVPGSRRSDQNHNNFWRTTVLTYYCRSKLPYVRPVPVPAARQVRKQKSEVVLVASSHGADHNFRRTTPQKTTTPPPPPSLPLAPSLVLPLPSCTCSLH